MRVVPVPSRGHLDAGGIRTQPLSGPPCNGLLARSASSALAPRLLTVRQSGTRKAGSAMPIDPTDLAKSIGTLGNLDPERGLAPTLQQIADSAKQLFAADGAGLMLVDADGQLRWASASGSSSRPKGC
jgi:hypothetical protein